MRVSEWVGEWGQWANTTRATHQVKKCVATQSIADSTLPLSECSNIEFKSCNCEVRRGEKRQWRDEMCRGGVRGPGDVGEKRRLLAQTASCTLSIPPI